jgi:hypothetical protein
VEGVDLLGSWLFLLSSRRVLVVARRFFVILAFQFWGVRLEQKVNCMAGRLSSRAGFGNAVQYIRMNSESFSISMHITTSATKYRPELVILAMQESCIHSDSSKTRMMNTLGVIYASRLIVH